MSKPVKPGADEAAEYVLGLLGKEDSRAFAQRLKSDEALRAQVEYWESMFSGLPGEEAEPPPAGMFEKILDRIEGEGADLPGTLDQDAQGRRTGSRSAPASRAVCCMSTARRTGNIC